MLNPVRILSLLYAISFPVIIKCIAAKKISMLIHLAAD